MPREELKAWHVWLDGWPFLGFQKCLRRLKTFREVSLDNGSSLLARLRFDEPLKKRLLVWIVVLVLVILVMMQ